MKKALLILFSIIILLEIYVSNFRVNFAIQTVFLGFIFVAEKQKISLRFIKTISPIVLIFLLGFLGFFLFNTFSTSVIKDISHFIKPVFALFTGYMVFKKINDKPIFYNTIITLAFVTSFIHLAGIFLFSNFFKSSINELRGDFGFDNYIEIFAFFILIFYNKVGINKNTLIYRYRNFLILFLLLSILLYFSRTMYAILILLGLSFFRFLEFNKIKLKILGLLFLMIVLFFGYLNTIKLDRNAKGFEAFLYKVKIAPEEIFNADINRDNHKELWDHWRAYEAKRAFVLMNENKLSYFTGTGYGSLVNLKFKAPLGEDGMKYISTLHNGYVNVFYKTGVFGILFYLMFLINLYLRIYHKTLSSEKKFIKICISTIGIYYFFTSVIITGVYIPKDTIVFILGGFLFFEEK